MTTSTLLDISNKETVRLAWEQYLTKEFDWANMNSDFDWSYKTIMITYTHADYIGQYGTKEKPTISMNRKRFSNHVNDIKSLDSRNIIKMFAVEEFGETKSRVHTHAIYMLRYRSGDKYHLKFLESTIGDLWSKKRDYGFIYNSKNNVKLPDYDSQGKRIDNNVPSQGVISNVQGAVNYMLKYLLKTDDPYWVIDTKMGSPDY